MNDKQNILNLLRYETNAKAGRPVHVMEPGPRPLCVASPPQPELNDLAEAGRKIGQTIEYMLQHLNKQLQVAKLAALVNVSPSHFFALFKRQTGCAPIDFFIRLRMQHACQLLEGTGLNVKEVAAALGYDDPFYFSRTFKGVNHVAPSEYRAMSHETKAAIRNAVLPSPGTGEAASSGRPGQLTLEMDSRRRSLVLQESDPKKESNGDLGREKQPFGDPGRDPFHAPRRNGSAAANQRILHAKGSLVHGQD